jgi:NADH-quinone oxidoreductase subunit B
VGTLLGMLLSPLAGRALPGTLLVSGHPDIHVKWVPLGLACCSVEIESAVINGLLEEGSADQPSSCTVVVVAGTVTDALAPGVVSVVAQAAESGPVRVLSFGACADSGGPYWDAPTVTKGIDQLLTVSAYVPGCPPRPEALVAAIVELAQRDELAP